MQISRIAKKLTADLSVMMPAVHAVLPSVPTSAVVNVGAFAKRLNTVLDPYGIRVAKDVDEQCDPNDDTWFQTTGGNCRFSIGFTIPRITITVNHHPTSSRWVLTPRRVHSLQHSFGRILSHELIHRYQMLHRGIMDDDDALSRTRIFLSTADDRAQQKEQEYHGDYDEIEAYAHDVVQEFYQRHPDAVGLSAYRLKNLIRHHFSGADDPVAKAKFPSLWFYREIFSGDLNHPAVATLFQKIHGWANHGRPMAHYIQPKF